MAAPAAAGAAKAAAAVLTDKKLRKIAGGIILGIIIVVIAPITLLHGMELSSYGRKTVEGKQYENQEIFSG